MNNYKYIINFAYDGTDFNGYGTQLHRNTVQDNIEYVLTLLNSNEKVKTFAASRTDTKVHAKDQYIQCKLHKKYDCKELKKKLNKLLKSSIYIKNITEDFSDQINVRYDVADKTYKYIVSLENNPFLRNYTYYEKYKLDLKKMQEAATLFIGEHDFTPFSNSRSQVKNKVRTINYLTLKEKELLGTKIIEIKINANGFLYNMVRIIVGILLEVGKEKLDKDRIIKIFQENKRTQECICYPAQALFLEKINYKDVL